VLRLTPLLVNVYVNAPDKPTAGRTDTYTVQAGEATAALEIRDAETGQLLGRAIDRRYTSSQGDLLTLTNRDVVLCHLNDAPAGIAVDQQQDNSRELPCATGVIDMKAFLGAMVEIGYDGPVLIEPFYRPLGEMSKEEALSATAAAMKKAVALVE